MRKGGSTRVNIWAISEVEASVTAASSEAGSGGGGRDMPPPLLEGLAIKGSISVSESRLSSHRLCFAEPFRRRAASWSLMKAAASPSLERDQPHRRGAA